jgi:hypothetical protein
MVKKIANAIGVEKGMIVTRSRGRTRTQISRVRPFPQAGAQPRRIGRLSKKSGGRLNSAMLASLPGRF